MQALTVGTKAPLFKLPQLHGSEVDLRAALEHGPVVLAFFKVSCPVCQMAFPFLERVYRKYGSKGGSFYGVSQDPAKDTEKFARQYGITFPILLDDTKKYPVSNAYGLTNVPTVFLIGQDGSVELSNVSWSRDELDALAASLAGTSGVPAATIFQPSDSVPTFKPG